ncbi:MAG: hypothetical protein RL391_11 [Actinomycetota bacterium]
MRRRVRDDHRLEPLASAVAQACRAGETLTAALRSANERHPTRAVTHVLQRHDEGLTLRASCLEFVDSKPASFDELLVAHVIALAADVGGPAERHFDALAQTLAERRNAVAERAVQASTARASIRVMTWVPLVVGVWLAVDNDQMRTTMLRTAPGVGCLVAGLALNLTGRLWATSLVRRT